MTVSVRKKFDGRGWQLFEFKEAQQWYASKKDRGYGVPVGIHFYLRKIGEAHYQVVSYPRIWEKRVVQEIVRKDGTKDQRGIIPKDTSNPQNRNRHYASACADPQQG